MRNLGLTRSIPVFWIIAGFIEWYGLMELWEKQQFILCCDPFILTSLFGRGVSE